MELICLVKTNELSGSVIGSLGDKADKADKKANTALTDSGTALTKAGEATTKADVAEDESAKATTSASNALALARSVRQEIAGRTLGPEQQRRVKMSVCNFGGINILITLHDAGKEINDLRDKIRGALPGNCMGGPGFVVSVSSPASETKPFSGIQVILQSEDTDPRHKSFAETLVSALMREGILAVGPLPPQDRGAVHPGATAYKVEISDSIEIDDSTGSAEKREKSGLSPPVAQASGMRVEIAIGDKP